MKRFLAITGLCFGLALFASAPNVKAQQIVPGVTKITSTTLAGDYVILENPTTKVAVSYKKGTFYTKTVGYTGGTIEIKDIVSGKTIFGGPVSGITFSPTVSGDSLKILWARQYLNN